MRLRWLGSLDATLLAIGGGLMLADPVGTAENIGWVLVCFAIGGLGYLIGKAAE